LKITSASTILRAVINPLKNNYLVRGAWCLLACASVARCGGRSHVAPPEPTAPLPTAGIAAQQVSVLPLTLLAADDSLHWDRALGDRRAGLARADSVLGTLLVARAPEVSWVLPDALRRAARRAPGIAPDPDQMGTAMLLRGEKLEVVPDPLRSELRTLAALAGSGGGRYALIPAGLVFRRTVGPSDGRTVAIGPSRLATAELTIVMVDVRTGRIGFRTVARGEGDDPWTALTRAVKSLTPGLP
jgi:hypothetical protein